MLFGLVACTTRPAAELMRLPASAPEHKAAQTRFFETRDANELLSASAAVLQDLGFHIDESVRDLGFLRATKERSARESGQEWARVFVLIVSFGYALIPVDLQQRIAATLVARPLGDDGTRHEVRIMFYRVVWQGDGQSNRDYIAPGQQRVEMIRDPVVYQQFFAKLSKAVFLEAFTL
ncbi:MAG TPA: hypothetical protein VF384_17940 [Planctomycetota bacterium]